ncbi:MAG: hypothetical protein DLM55_11550 [Acidimicrobiales bacterium]|nr:MAG: hypothetical protein DLM55_11550 [Acidimicrobiales bacterium]
MSTRRISLTIDTAAHEVVKRAASRLGISASALISRGALNEAIRCGAPPPRNVDAAAQSIAAADEAEFAYAQREGLA